MGSRSLTAALNETLLSSHPLEDGEISPSIKEYNFFSSVSMGNLGSCAVSKLIMVDRKTALNES